MAEGGCLPPACAPPEDIFGPVITDVQATVARVFIIGPQISWGRPAQRVGGKAPRQQKI
jgi:hypothetical protein